MPEREPEPGAARRESLVSLTETEAAVLRSTGREPMTAEAICEASHLPPAQVAGTLTRLQLKGVLRRVQGDLFERVF
ncbi:MAG: hypothetical protein ACE5E1_09585 [Phycisphaerae bacterium]